MTMKNRRQVLQSISHLALSLPLLSCSGKSDVDETVSAQAGVTGNSDRELLASLAYDLFPFPELPIELYVEVADRLLQTHNPVLAEGVQTLKQAAGNHSWKALSEDNRIGILTSMQDTAFFALVRATALEVLYRSPATFAIVGYGGSAIEQGGYINRGFADINWLPATAHKE